MSQAGPKKRSFTVMVVPHSASAPLSFQLSLRFIQAFCTVTVLIIVGVVVFVGNYHTAVARAGEVETLRQVNVRQKQQISELVTQMESLQTRLAELDELDQQLRAMLSMDLGYGETSGAIIAAASGTQSQALGVGGGDASRAELLAPADASSAAVDNLSVLGDPSLDDTMELEGTVAEVRSALGTRRESLEEVTLALQDQLSFLMARPTGWPAQGIITSNFGYRRNPYGWGREFHDGIDVAAPIGTPIFATANGVVTFAAWKTGYGRMVVVRHGFGFETRYAHNSRTVVSVGDEVERGDIIAYVGNTGRSTGPHVHYEVRRYGKLYDPREYLKPPID